MQSIFQEEVKVWRPPTPPRGAAINADQTPPSPKLSTISFPKMSTVPAYPFSFESVDEESSSPKQTPANATICLSVSDNECSPPKMSTNNSTFCLSTETEENIPSTMSTFEKIFPESEPENVSISSAVDSFPIQTLTMTTNPMFSYAQFLDIPQELSTGLPMTRNANVDSTSSLKSSFANESPNPPSALNATMTLDTPSVGSKLDSTNVLSKGNADIEARRLTFLIPTVDENKESQKKMVAPPIAMVSPMTSHVVSTSQGAAGGVKAKKSLKQAFQMPFASTSNLRSMLDLKPAAQKSRFVTFFLHYLVLFNLVRLS